MTSTLAEWDEGAQRESNERRRGKYALRDAARHLQPKGPRCCGKYATQSRLSIVRKNGRSSLAGSQLCGMVWLCPICAARILAKRLEEITTAINNHHAQGGRVTFLTLTVAHSAKDDLRTLLKVHSQALTRFRRRMRDSGIADDLAIVGDIVNYEVTHGGWHGWHPHRHLLVFHKATETIEDNVVWVRWENLVRDMWRLSVSDVSPKHTPSATINVGIKAEMVPLDGGGAYATYMTKGVEEAALELASPETKAGGRTPFRIL